jgi:hypothetical protein
LIIRETEKLGLTDEELNIFLYGYSLKKDDDIEHPLSKMVRDILDYN